MEDKAVKKWSGSDTLQKIFASICFRRVLKRGGVLPVMSSCLCVYMREGVTSSDVSYKVRTEHFPEVLHLIFEANL